MRPLRLLFRDSVVYGMAGAANRMAKILVVPLVARTFPAETFGAYDSAGVAIYVLATLGILGLHSSVIIIASREAGRTTPAGMAGPASTGLRVTVVTSLLLSAAVILARRPVAFALLGSTTYAGPLAWAAASIPFTTLLLYLLALLQWSFRRAWYVGVAVGSAILTIALTYVSAFYTDLGLTGLFGATLVGQAVGAGLALVAARDMLRERWSREFARDMIKVGLPFAIVGVAGTFMPVVDRFFLVQAHSLETAGRYGVGQKIAVLAVLILMGFQAAWGPFAFGQRNEAAKGRIFGRVFLVVCGVAALLSLVLMFAAPALARIIATPAYLSSAIFVGPLALSYGLTAVFFVVAIGSVLEGRSLHNLIAYLGGLAIMMGTNLSLALAEAPPVGIAWANCLGQAAAVLIMARLSQRVHPVPYPFLHGVAVLLLAGAVAAALGGEVVAMPLAVNVVLALVTVAAFAAWLWWGVLDPAERSYFRRRVARGASA